MTDREVPEGCDVRLCGGCKDPQRLTCDEPGTTCLDMLDAWGLGFERGRIEGWRQADRARSAELPVVHLVESDTAGLWEAAGAVPCGWSVQAWPDPHRGVDVCVRLAGRVLAHVTVHDTDEGQGLEEAQAVASAILWSGIRAWAAKKGGAVMRAAADEWRDVAMLLHEAYTAGVSVEVLEMYTSAIRRGDSAREAAQWACDEWDAVPTW